MAPWPARLPVTPKPSAHARGYTRRWQAIARTFYGQPCHYKFPGVCTGIADTCDHVIPKARGGTDDLANLVPACRACNSAKRDRLSRRTTTPAPPPVSRRW